MTGKFDIHKYGHDLVDNLNQLKTQTEVPLQKVVGKVEAFEVCRNFGT